MQDSVLLKRCLYGDIWKVLVWINKISKITLKYISWTEIICEYAPKVVVVQLGYFTPKGK